MENNTPSISSNLNGKVLSPLIDFDFIVNTDLGLIRFIQKNYQDDKAFDLNILNKSDREILSLLYTRKDINPLTIISIDEDINSVNELYKSFFDTYKKDIIDNSTVSAKTDNFIRLISHNGFNFGISPFIAIRDDLEKNEIMNHYQNFSFVYKSDKAAIQSKDPFYIKDYSIFTDVKLESLSHKKIYMRPLQYSIDYFENFSNYLTSRNIFILMGTDYRNREENKS